MLTKYIPDELPRFCDHVVELTYMFDTERVVIRAKMGGNCSGADILNCYTEFDSDWLDAPYEIVQGKFSYSPDDEAITVECERWPVEINVFDLHRYLVSVAIVDVLEV